MNYLYRSYTSSYNVHIKLNIVGRKSKKGFTGRPKKPPMCNAYDNIETKLPI